MIFAKVKVSDFCAMIEYRRTIPTGLIGGEVAFEFIDPLWDALDKFVVFESGHFTKVDVLEGNLAIIPPEAVAKGNEGNCLKVGVFGTDAENGKGVPTFWANLGKIRDAADPMVDPNASSSLPIWATIMAKVKALESGGPVSEDVLKQITQDVVEEYLEENPIETPDLTDQVERAETAAANAEAAKESVGTSVNLAGGYASTAHSSANRAEQASNSAQGYAGSASSSAIRAEEAATAAETAKQGAINAQSAAMGAIGQATIQANNAADSATRAEKAATDAESAAKRAEEAAESILDSGGNIGWLDPEEGEVFTSIVPEPTLTGISASYTGGDVLIGTALSALVGIVVTAAYSDGTTKTVTDYTLSGSITEGSNTITVTYEGMTTTFTVTGIAEEPEVTLSSISATYTGGNVAVGTVVTDLTGITVTAHYSDGSTATVTDYTLSGTIAEGSNTITVSYGGKTATFTVTGEAETGGGSESEDFTGTENAFIRDGYYYVNPLTSPGMFTYDTYASDTAHAVLALGNGLIGSQFDVDLTAGTGFANIPYLGNSTAASIRKGTAFPDAEFGWATDYVNNFYRILIPMSVYEEAGNNADAAMYSIMERVGIKLVANYEDYLYEVTDELIDGMTGTPSTTLTDDGFYTGFLTWAGIGLSVATGIGCQCIPFGATGYGNLTYETYGIRITNRFHYCVPSTVDTSSLDNFKTYLKSRGIKFLCGTAKEAT